MTDIYFATNRTQRRSKKRPFGDRFHQDGPHFYRVGVARAKKVSDDADEGYKVEGVEVVPETPPEEKGGEEAVVGSSALFSALRQKMVEDGRDILIYIHGFANSFESCIERGAQLRQAYLIQPPDGGTPYEPHMFVFSWPSNGRVTPPWEYFDDRDDAAASGVAMARSLKRLLDFLAQGDEPCPQAFIWWPTAWAIGPCGMPFRGSAPCWTRAACPRFSTTCF